MGKIEEDNPLTIIPLGGIIRLKIREEFRWQK